MKSMVVDVPGAPEEEMPDGPIANKRDRTPVSGDVDDEEDFDSGKPDAKKNALLFYGIGALVIAVAMGLIGMQVWPLIRGMMGGRGQVSVAASPYASSAGGANYNGYGGYGAQSPYNRQNGQAPYGGGGYAPTPSGYGQSPARQGPPQAQFQPQPQPQAQPQPQPQPQTQPQPQPLSQAQPPAGGFYGARSGMPEPQPGLGAPAGADLSGMGGTSGGGGPATGAAAVGAGTGAPVKASSGDGSTLVLQIPAKLDTIVTKEDDITSKVESLRAELRSLSARIDAASQSGAEDGQRLQQAIQSLTEELAGKKGKKNRKDRKADQSAHGGRGRMQPGEPPAPRAAARNPVAGSSLSYTASAPEARSVPRLPADRGAGNVQRPQLPASKDWVMRSVSVSSGMAWIGAVGSGATQSVVIGQSVPGIGVVTGFRQLPSGKWEIQGSAGRIEQP